MSNSSMSAGTEMGGSSDLKAASDMALHATGHFVAVNIAILVIYSVALLLNGGVVATVLIFRRRSLLTTRLQRIVFFLILSCFAWSFVNVSASMLQLFCGYGSGRISPTAYTGVTTTMAVGTHVFMLNCFNGGILLAYERYKRIADPSYDSRKPFIEWILLALALILASLFATFFATCPFYDGLSPSEDVEFRYWVWAMIAFCIIYISIVILLYSWAFLHVRRIMNELKAANLNRSDTDTNDSASAEANVRIDQSILKGCVGITVGFFVCYSPAMSYYCLLYAKLYGGEQGSFEPSSLAPLHLLVYIAGSMDAIVTPSLILWFQRDMRRACLEVVFKKYDMADPKNKQKITFQLRMSHHGNDVIHISKIQDENKRRKTAIHFPSRMLLVAGIFAACLTVTLILAGSVPGHTEKRESDALSGISTNHVPEQPPHPRSQKPNCPKWEMFNVKEHGDKDFSLNCRVISPQVNGFEIKLCESMRECGQGYFLLKRLDKAQCTKAMTRSISWDYEFEAWMKKEIGPDAFVITFSGPQRAAPSDWRHLGNCNYKHPFRLTNTGNYTVSIIHSHENFEAIQETERTWLRPVNNHLLTDWPMDVCSNHCKPFTSDVIEAMSLPVCNRFLATQGVYLRSVEGHMLEREKYKLENYNIPYYWHPLACKYDQLFELGSDNKCHANNRSIKFFGDSQVRVSWDVTDRRMAGTRDLLKYSVHEGKRVNYYYQDQKLNLFWERGRKVPKAPSRHKQRTMLNFAGRDGFLRWFTSEYILNQEFRGIEDKSNPETNKVDRRLKAYDSVIFNVGMWPMSGIRVGGHFTAGRYKTMLAWAAENLMEVNHRRASMKVEPLIFVWHGLPSYPLMKTVNEKIRIKKDWRSPYRLKIWSDIAEHVLSSTLQRSSSIRVINAFELTHPFLHDAPDAAHFYKTPAVEAETDEILHKLNICNAPI
ncbi:hypothetical protein CcCBS67573_g03737 [Chytriomyces confervae]|uniref:G-protein coupled receptors family 1 profile domain-containing protein n=1 Tax=Chytriomyces confervae TaxID=246404 RepID=A0A507FHA4_9FUNG|nr:hypothetical protein CcCBS67573_g03737 [Chytriomyces confervae]